MIFKKTRIDEDLQRIRDTNLPYKNIIEDKKHENELNLEKGDLLAITLAVMSLIVPYIIVFVGIMAGVVFLLGHFY